MSTPAPHSGDHREGEAVSAPQTITKAEMAELMGMSPEAFQTEIDNTDRRPPTQGPNRAQRRAMKWKGR